MTRTFIQYFNLWTLIFMPLSAKIFQGKGIKDILYTKQPKHCITCILPTQYIEILNHQIFQSIKTVQLKYAISGLLGPSMMKPKLILFLLSILPLDGIELHKYCWDLESTQKLLIYGVLDACQVKSLRESLFFLAILH